MPLLSEPTLLDFLKDWSQLIVVGTAALGVLFTLWRKVAKPIKAISVIVEAQLKTNGGSSLVDMAKKIQPNHVEAQEHWANLEAKNKEIADALVAKGQLITDNYIEAQSHWTALEQGHTEIKAAFASGVKTLEQREQVFLSRMNKLDSKSTQAATVQAAQVDTAKVEIIERIDTLESDLSAPLNS